MGVLPQHMLDELDQLNRSDYAMQQRHTVVRLPCCGASVEREAGATEQYVTCPNKWCPKLSAGFPARHLVIWNPVTTQIKSEEPQLEL